MRCRSEKPANKKRRLSDKTRPCLRGAAAARRLFEVSLPLTACVALAGCAACCSGAPHSNTYLVVVSLPTLCRVNIYTNAQRTLTILAEPLLFSTFACTLIFHRCSEQDSISSLTQVLQQLSLLGFHELGLFPNLAVGVF